MLVIRNTVRSVILSMLTPEHRNGKSPVAEKAMYEVLLMNSSQLAEFFGRDDANNFLMPLLITCLNSPS
jgi:phosphoinositide-3-kinase, regulatory subunit 4